MTALLAFFSALGGAALVLGGAADATPKGPEPAAPMIDLAADTVSVPFDASSGHIVVPVEVNGNGPHLFVLDTGAQGHGRIDPALVSELKLPNVGDARAADGTQKNTRTVHLVGIDSLRVGDAIFRDLVLAAVAVQRPPAEPGAPPTVDTRGILGFGLFTDVLLTIDYPQSRLVLTRGSLDPAAPHTVELLGNLDIARVPIEVDMAKLEAHLDTGNMGGFTVSTDLLATMKTVGLPWLAGRARTLNNEFEVHAVRLSGPLRVADFRFDTTEASYVDIFRGANLGYLVLKNFAITFDQANRLATFAREETGRLDAPAKRAASPSAFSK